MPHTCRTLFVTGTDTGVGKTHAVAAILAHLGSLGLRVGAYKPACSGAEASDSGDVTWDDVERLKAELPQGTSVDRICPQRFCAPLAPPLAAAAEGRLVDLAAIDQGLNWWLQSVDYLVVEGAGGWLCPLTATSTFADWVSHQGFPVLIVARPGLGTINHTLLTIAAVRQLELPVVGVVFSQTRPDESTQLAEQNAAEIEARTGVPVFGMFGWGTATQLRRASRDIKIKWSNVMSPLGRAILPGDRHLTKDHSIVANQIPHVNGGRAT